MESESDVETTKKKQSLCHGLEFIWKIASEFYLYIYFLGRGGGVWGEVGEEKYIITRKIKCSISCPPKIEMEALYKIINMLSKK